MKNLILLIALTFLSCMVPNLYTHQDNLLEDTINRAALVEIVCDGKKAGWGSAAYIGDNHAVTATHVVDSPRCKYLLDGVETQVSKASRKLDIAYLTTDKKIASVPIRTPRLGEHIICAGYSRQYFRSEKPKLSVSYGSILTVGFDNGLVRISTVAHQGHSGGACYSKRDGSLLGIIVSMHSHNDNTPIHGYIYLRSLL